MVMLAFVVLGLFSYQRLKVDQFPDIDFPTVVVQTEYPGAAPEVVAVAEAAVHAQGAASDEGIAEEAAGAGQQFVTG